MACHIFLINLINGHGDHILIILWLLIKLANLDHVSGTGKSHIPKGQATLLIDDLQHGINVGVVKYQKALGILDCVALLLQDGYAEAVEGIDISGVIVSGKIVDSLAHLIGRFVGKGDAQNVSRQNSDLIYQKGKPVGKCPGFTGTRTGDDTYISFCSGYCLCL